MVPLQRHRRLAGLTQRELAGVAGVSVDTIRAIEGKRQRRPYPGTMRKIAAALAIPIADVIEFADGGNVGEQERETP